MPFMTDAFQDLIGSNFCFGCGPDNPDGLRLKSRWAGEEAVARFRPAPIHAAGPRHVVNGGVLATVLDCHAICTAVADAYRREGREPGSAPRIWFVTGRLDVRYHRPAPIGRTLELRARVVEVSDRKSRVEASVAVGERMLAEASVVAVRVAPDWLSPPSS